MKGLLKLSTVALSAAMVAGMSTPVFAAGTKVTETSPVTVSVKNKAGYVIASTDNKTTVLNENGTTKGNGSAETPLALTLFDGDVKQLSGTASDSSTVKFGLVTDDDNYTDAKAAVTVTEDGKITVSKDAKSETYAVVAYTDKMVGDNGEIKEDVGALKINVTVETPTKLTALYDKADSVYTNYEVSHALKDADDKNTTPLTEIKNTTDKLGVATSTAADRNVETNKAYNVNHVSLGETTTFTATLADASNETSNADYNTLLKFAPEVANDGTNVTAAQTAAKKFVKVTQDSESNKFTVSYNGTSTENGLVWINGAYNDSKEVATTEATRLYLVADSVAEGNVYRVYNPNSGEHFYTESAKEVKALEDAGWTLESIAWVAPTSGTEVYRLYNPNSGEHHYTTSAKEKNALVALGWKDENVAFYSASANYTKIYRLYNRNAFAFNHHYTTSTDENRMLASLGWKAEGVAFYALSKGNSDKEATVAADEAQAKVDEALAN